MAQAVGQFSPINAGESEVFGFDFSLDLIDGDTIASIQSVTLVQAGGSGTDPDPASRLVGAAFITDDAIVSQRISNPVANVVYRLAIYAVTTNGNVLDLWSYIVCAPLG